MLKAAAAAAAAAAAVPTLTTATKELKKTSGVQISQINLNMPSAIYMPKKIAREN
jgi:hypothetical protein